MDPRIKLIIEKERKGKASALNKILERNKGEYLFLLPGDVIPAKNSLPQLLNLLTSSSEIGVVCGKPVPVNTKNGFMGYLSHLMWRMHNRTLLYLDSLALNTHVSGELMLMKPIIKKIPADVINEDAYIGIIATSRNLRTRYCSDATVYIKAPSNVVDFIKQRRRIIYGHYRVKSLTGKFSPTLQSMATLNSNKTVRIVADEIKEHPKDIFKFILAIGLEATANILGVADLLFRREHILWKRVDSTKKRVSS
jgi:biofilm PGA synthesis N-glycosyltransferase PgaC